MAEPGEPPPASNVIAFRAPEAEGGLWPRIQAQLLRDDPALYNTWFAALRSESGEDGTLTLLAPTRFFADYVTSNLIFRIERAAREAGSAGARIEIIWQP